MESSSPSSNINKFVEELPKSHFISENVEIRKWEGYWLRPLVVAAAVAFQRGFHARDDDIFLASSVKTGTTWLKALSFCIMQRHHHQTLDPLTLENPHALVPTVEVVKFTRSNEVAGDHDSPKPRLLHTHLPYALLPDSIRKSSCKIVYIARNPNDTVISGWHFYSSLLRRDGERFPLEKFVECYCSGVHTYGPFVEHVAGYWEESRKSPQKILFVKYKELKAEPKSQIMKIAEFLGRPFGDEGEVEEIVRRCSFERLKNLEVNKNGSNFVNTPISSFFRKGEVGDSKHYLTPEIEMQIDQAIRLKLEAIGLYF